MSSFGGLFRERFPILEKKVYLASHSLGAVPRAAEAAIREYYSNWAEEGVEVWSGQGAWWKAIGEFSRDVERVLRAPSGTVVPMENVTRGMAAVASCLDFSGKRKQVILTDLEFTTSYPFWQGAEKLGAEIVIVKSEDGITVPAERIVEAIRRADDRLLIVPLAQVYFRSGALQDLKAVARAAHDVGAYFLADGYQSVGTVPTDVVDMDCDFFVGGSHKWLCGGAGAGYLYVRQDLISKLRPSLSGWFGVSEPFGYEIATRFEPHPGVQRFLAGTPAIAPLFAAREGIRTVLEAGPARIREISAQTTRYIIERADAAGFDVRTPRDPAARSGMVCLQFDGSKEAAEKLVAGGVLVDWRPGCGIRVSPHFYNSREDIDVFFKGVEAWRSAK